MKLPDDVKVAFVSAGRRATAVLTDDGKIYTCGSNNGGALGRPSSFTGTASHESATSADPTLIDGVSDVVMRGVACGDGFMVSYAYNSKGESLIYIWGTFAGESHRIPTAKHTFRGADQKVIQIAAGSSHIVVLTEEDGLYAAGAFSYGQLGTTSGGPTRMRQAMTQLEPIEALRTEKIVQVACGGYHTLALNDKGDVYAWGAGEYGQLGLPGKPHSVFRPTLVKALEGLQVSFIACGASHSIALTKDGQVCFTSIHLRSWEHVLTCWWWPPFRCTLGAAITMAKSAR
jgi:alpha-tubulin suppressor-like RCC1 family protein